MSLEITINADIKTAMLAQNEAALRGLRAVKSAILLAKTADGKTGDLTEEDEMKILQKLVQYIGQLSPRANTSYFLIKSFLKIEPCI